MITDKDYAVSATALMMPKYLKSIEFLRGKVDRMVDLGCAYGGVTSRIAQHLNVKEVYHS